MSAYPYCTTPARTSGVTSDRKSAGCPSTPSRRSWWASSPCSQTPTTNLRPTSTLQCVTSDWPLSMLSPRQFRVKGGTFHHVAWCLQKEWRSNREGFRKKVARCVRQSQEDCWNRLSTPPPPPIQSNPLHSTLASPTSPAQNFEHDPHFTVHHQQPISSEQLPSIFCRPALRTHTCMQRRTACHQCFDISCVLWFKPQSGRLLFEFTYFAIILCVEGPVQLVCLMTKVMQWKIFLSGQSVTFFHCDNACCLFCPCRGRLLFKWSAVHMTKARSITGWFSRHLFCVASLYLCSYCHVSLVRVRLSCFRNTLGELTDTHTFAQAPDVRLDRIRSSNRKQQCLLCICGAVSPDHILSVFGAICWS